MADYSLHDTDDSSLIQLVTFKIADEDSAFDILKVQEIIRMMPITKFPMRLRLWKGSSICAAR